MKIVNMKKFIRSILIILGILALCSIFITNPSLSRGDVEYKTIYVMQGETLWGIATELQSSSYYNGRDVRFIISDHIIDYGGRSAHCTAPTIFLSTNLLADCFQRHF